MSSININDVSDDIIIYAYNYKVFCLIDSVRWDIWKYC
jgi:hypothetical protein